jgi:hypothetical protein
MFFVADGRTRRMHTVPEGYFEAFAVSEQERRTSHVWRFDRYTGESKLLGVGDTEVAKDIYAVFNGTEETKAMEGPAWSRRCSANSRKSAS